MTAARTEMLQKKISIVLVEDHALLREGIRTVIGSYSDLEVIGEASTGEQALEAIMRLRPDVVLLDVNLPLMNGIQVLTQLKAKHSETAVIVLTIYDDPEQMIHAFRAGAAGFCAKDIAPEVLVNYIHHVTEGKYVVGDRVLDEKGLRKWIVDRVGEITDLRTVIDGEPHTPLSQREMEILKQVVGEGASNQEIALKLNISHQTVKNHMTSILRKLNVQDRTQAAVYAIRRGWFRVNERRENEDEE